MTQLYYDHLTNIGHLYAQIESLPLTPAQKTQAVSLIETLLHYHVLITVLNYLPSNYHLYYLESFFQQPNDLHLLAFLKQHIHGIESHISSLSDEIQYTTLSTIRQLY